MEYKFRGKKLFDGDWVYGVPHTYGDGTFICPMEINMLFSAKEMALDNYEVDPKSVGMFSGMKDLDGTDIYEKDVVYIVGYGDYLAEFPFYTLYEYAAEKDVERIKGNIIDNPELLGNSK